MSNIQALEKGWYDLFSRGAKDLLRHNQKIRDSLKQHLPDLLADQNVITQPKNRTILVPVKFLEHARLRLNTPMTDSGVGQGEGGVGDVLVPGQGQGQGQPGEQPGQGAGSEGGEIKFVVELKLDEVLDYLWEELKLPDLKPKRSATLEDPDYKREGWDKQGARSRLDRRKTVKEAIKRRAVQEDPIPFTNEDLRFRQLVKKQRPSTNAVVFFALDVSGSMGEEQRKIAKTFFFFALQGIRRQYSKVDVVFIAHASHAREFSEEEFFKAADGGGTVSSTAFKLVSEIMEKRYDPTSYNVYFFYASDGDNEPNDLPRSVELLTKLAKQINYAGYVETDTGAMADMRGGRASQLANLFHGLKAQGLPVGACPLSNKEDVWAAIREFFSEGNT